MEFKIRAASPADIRAMHKLRNGVRENRLLDARRVTEASYRPYVAAGSAWVADTGSGIAGFAVIDGPARRVWALFVDPEAEGEGIGRALHSKMVAWALEQGIPSLSLSTDYGTRAMQFYRRAGWTQGSAADGEVPFEKSLLGIGFTPVKPGT